MQLRGRHAGTPVASEDGEKASRDVAVRERVLTYDETMGVTGAYTVTTVWAHLDHAVVTLTIDFSKIVMMQ